MLTLTIRLSLSFGVQQQKLLKLLEVTEPLGSSNPVLFHQRRKSRWAQIAC
jgi:hypothetical protein